MLNEEIRERIENLRLDLIKKSKRVSSGNRGGRLSLEELGEIRELKTEYGSFIILEKCVNQYLRTEDVELAARKLLGTDDRASSYIFLDLETTGFAATPLFLAGTLYRKDDSLYVGQLLARDYSEEAGLINGLDAILEKYKNCITFNGKSFDIPYIRERAKYHKIDLKASPRQFDLLHHARRRWRRSLPNCRLVTLEWYILGRRRFGDIASWEVPCIYHEFVHTRDATRLVDVLRHNLVDVLSMAELLVALSEGK